MNCLSLKKLCLVAALSQTIVYATKQDREKRIVVLDQELAQEIQTLGAWDRHDSLEQKIFVNRHQKLLKRTQKAKQIVEQQDFENINPYAPDLSCGQLYATCLCSGIAIAYHYIINMYCSDDLKNAH